MLKALRCEDVIRPPIWLLRQAGRYQPKYLQLRKQAPQFMDFCKNPELTSQAAMLPIVDFNLDSAILFSDILTIPEALGMELYFKENIGPVFTRPIQNSQDIASLTQDNIMNSLSYVTESLQLLKAKLAGSIPIIGFGGSPWTLATYMVQGQSSKDFAQTKKFAFSQPKNMHALLQVLTDVSKEYLAAQIRAGADIIMLFDTWGGILSLPDYEEFSLSYMEQIISYINKEFSSKIPSIIFTKGGNAWLPQIANSGCSAISIDWTMPLTNARAILPSNIALQGNLDPSILYASDAAITTRVKQLLAQHANTPGYIFNLGHGIPKDAEPKKVKLIADIILNFNTK